MSVNFKNASIKNATVSPRIVYDSSLVLALDPANPLSYYGSGVTANNLITSLKFITMIKLWWFLAGPEWSHVTT